MDPSTYAVRERAAGADWLRAAAEEEEEGSRAVAGRDMASSALRARQRRKFSSDCCFGKEVGFVWGL